MDVETDKVLRVYRSGSHAAIDLGCTQSGDEPDLTYLPTYLRREWFCLCEGISQCVRGRQPHYHGFKWAYYTGPPIDCAWPRTLTLP